MRYRRAAPMRVGRRLPFRDIAQGRGAQRTRETTEERPRRVKAKSAVETIRMGDMDSADSLIFPIFVINIAIFA